MSSWSDFLDNVTQLGTAGAEAYQTVKDAGKTSAAPATPAASPSWLKPVLIGGGVLLAVVLLLSFTRK